MGVVGPFQHVRCIGIVGGITMRTWRSATLCVVFAIGLGSPSRVDAQVLVIKAARLLDGRGGPPLEPAMVRIAGQRIEEVGASITVPAGARVIDLAGATL